MSDMTLNEQMNEVQEIIGLMQQHQCVAAKLQAGGPGEGQRFVAHTLLEKYLDTGSILTRVQRLPSHQSSVLKEYLLGSPPYHDIHPNLKVTLKNISAHPVRVLTGSEYRPDYNPFTGEEEDRGTVERFYEDIEPGETLELTAKWALSALFEFCKLAWEPRGQRRWPDVKDCLREVAYRYELKGKEYRTPQHKKK